MNLFFGGKKVPSSWEVDGFALCVAGGGLFCFFENLLPLSGDSQIGCEDMPKILPTIVTSHKERFGN